MPAGPARRGAGSLKDLQAPLGLQAQQAEQWLLWARAPEPLWPRSGGEHGEGAAVRSSSALTLCPVVSDPRGIRLLRPPRAKPGPLLAAR